MGLEYDQTNKSKVMLKSTSGVQSEFTSIFMIIYFLTIRYFENTLIEFRKFCNKASCEDFAS